MATFTGDIPNSAEPTWAFIDSIDFIKIESLMAS